MKKVFILIITIFALNVLNARNEHKNANNQNCFITISTIYSDFWEDKESGDLGGTVSIIFTKLSEGKYEAQLEQRFGAEGSTYPKQTINDLFVDIDGNITFSINWFTCDTGDKSKFVRLNANGTISKFVLKFKIDIPNSPEYILESLEN